MAKLAERSLLTPPERIKPRGVARYDWDKWLDGPPFKVFDLVEGDDFDNLETLRSAARQAAGRRGVKVTIQKVDSTRGRIVAQIQAREA